MQRPIFARRPLFSVRTPDLPPMYDWPRPIKYTLMSACVILCIIVYAIMASGMIELATLVLGVLQASAS
jgi:hypothetical protein